MSGSVRPFTLQQVKLLSSRFSENQDRTLSYLKFIDVDRLLHVYRLNHKVPSSAPANGGWDSPSFPFRSHFQGHVLSAWAQCGDGACRDRAASFVKGLEQCQNSNAGFSAGYLSGFPESDFDGLVSGGAHGNVPYYVLHKLLAGLLDVWKVFGDATAKSVLLALAGWVDKHTGALSQSQMQASLGTEHGGMLGVLADLAEATGDTNWLTVARRFDHKATLDPLERGVDNLAGLHANTQLAKWVGAARLARVSGEARFRSIATNAWDIVVKAHSFAIGGNSVGEHFRGANAIASTLGRDTAESCNTYNMLKLTRELWMLAVGSDTKYFDYYETALYNHMLGQQDPTSPHGHVTYFMSLGAGNRRGVGPGWGGGTWSTDYSSFWCCQGTGVETNTKFADSIYFRSDDALYVNLYIPSELDDSTSGLHVEQATDYPREGTSKITVTGRGISTILLRIPAWTKTAEVIVGDERKSASPGAYFAVPHDGTTTVVQLTLWLGFRQIAANDDAKLAAVAFGPLVLAGNFGSKALLGAPSLSVDSLQRTGTDDLAFTGKSDGQTVELTPFYDAHDFNYVTYWRVQ